MQTPQITVIQGQRDRLEAELVEDLFLGRYDARKAAALSPRGHLRIASATRPSARSQAEPKPPHR